jgi:hypothetical protein
MPNQRLTPLSLGQESIVAEVGLNVAAIKVKWGGYGGKVFLLGASSSV